ncbi:MAG: P-II family nitrogen regulator [Dehalococcoidia bacterium]
MTEEGKTLIVTIVAKGCGDRAMEASIKAGAEGGTIIFGRGVGIHEKKKVLGVLIEPEKEIVLTVTPPDQADAILDAIVAATRLEEPGRGIAFTIRVDRFVGAVHSLLTDPPGGACT